MAKASSAAAALRRLFRRNSNPRPVIQKENSEISSENSSPETVEPKPSDKLYDFVKIFKKKSSSPEFRQSVWHYKTTVDRLANAGQFSRVDEILQHQKQYPDIKDEEFTSRLIACYGEAKMLDNALKMFDEMPHLNCPRTVVSFNSLLSACYASENYDKVLELLRELPPKLSIETNVISYTLAIKALCKKGLFDDAVSFLDEMAAKGVDPDAVTFDVILYDLYHCGKFSEAENLWNSMKEKKVDPDSRCYNSRLYGMLSERHFSDAVELVKEMEEKGMKLNTYAYNLFIKAYVNEGDVKEVKKWYAAMEKSGAAAAPNIFTYVLLVPFAVEKIGIDYAFELCKKSVNTNGELSRKTVMKVRDELLNNSKIEEAKELLDFFKKEKPPPKAVDREEIRKISSEPKTVEPAPQQPLGKLQKIVETFKKNSDSIRFREQPKPYAVTVRRLAQAQQLSLVDEILQHQKQYPSIRDELFTTRLITLYGEAKMLDRALQLFDEMPELSCPRTAFSFNALLAACFNSGSFDKLLELFRELPSKLSIGPDVTSYTFAVKAHCRKGSFDDAISLLEEMASNGVNPDAATFHTLLSHLYHDGRFSEGEKVWELMKEMKVDPDLKCYNARFFGMMGEKRVADAMELVKELGEKGMEPNTYMYNSFIRAAVDEGDVERVKKLYADLERSAAAAAAADFSTYSTLVPFALENDIDWAFELCKGAARLRRRKLKREIVMKVKDELVKCSKVEEAKDLMQLFNLPT